MKDKNSLCVIRKCRRDYCQIYNGYAICEFHLGVISDLPSLAETLEYLKNNTIGG